jgi:hypothetical protein
MARRDLLGQPVDSGESILDGPKVATLLAGQKPDGGFGVHPYRKWLGAHWRLVSLVELEIPAGEPRAVEAANTVLDWLTGDEHRDGIVREIRPTRIHASQEGNALAVACRLGLADDPRSGELVERLIDTQWPDGGWNCDPRASGRRSSFHETHSPAWGLFEYWESTGSVEAKSGALRAAELFLEHRLYRKSGTGSVINSSWGALHYPPYWHYDILQGLLVLSRMGLAGDDRAADALDLLERRRLPDGRWQPGAYWWLPPGSGKGPPEVVDWGRSSPNEMITLNALRVFRAARRPTG